MNKTNPQGHSPDHTHRSHRPYWKRAHRDWRIWCFVVVMLVAMFIYLATGDLRWRAGTQPQQPRQPISAPAGN